MKAQRSHLDARFGLRIVGISSASSALLAAALFFSGCSGKGSANPQNKNGTKPSVPVIAAQAEAKDIPIELRNIGNIEAYATVTIRSQITGQITKIHFQEGQEVKAGDLLFTIDPRPSQGALRQAQRGMRRDLHPERPTRGTTPEREHHGELDGAVLDFRHG